MVPGAPFRLPNGYYQESTTGDLYIQISMENCISKITTGNTTSQSSSCIYGVTPNPEIVTNNLRITDPDGSFAKFLPVVLNYSGISPSRITCINSSGKTLIFNLELYTSYTPCNTASKNIGQCPGKTQNILNKDRFWASNMSDIIMGVDPTTMQWTFTQGGITYGPGVVLVLLTAFSPVYTFDFSAVASMHVFGFTSEACGDTDVTEGITYNTTRTRMTFMATPSMRTKQYWYACQIHNCMTSLTPIAFI